VVLAGDVGRMNTVFKLAFQCWWMMGIAAAVATIEVARRAPRRRRRPALAVIGALVVAAAAYPVRAVPGRLADRFPGPRANGLDGLAFLEWASWEHPSGRRIDLRWDAAAMRWLRSSVDGLPVLAESNRLAYGWGSRMSMATGLPTVVGWVGHQRQQRRAVRFDLVGRRDRDLASLYETTDLDEAARLLARYGVGFVVLGELERASYPGPGLAKLESAGPLWSLAYENPGTRILRVDRRAVGRRLARQGAAHSVGDGAQDDGDEGAPGAARRTVVAPVDELGEREQEADGERHLPGGR
jgi:uncharacterized membrane protein